MLGTQGVRCDTDCHTNHMSWHALYVLPYMSGAQAHTIGLAYGGPILIAPLGGTGFVVLLCFVLFWFCFGLFCVYFPTVYAAGRCIHLWRCPIGHTRAYSHIFICVGSHTHTHTRTYAHTHACIGSRYSYGSKFGREEQRPMGLWELAQVCIHACT